MSGQESSLLEEFMATISVPDDEIDLARAALLIDKIEYPELEIEPVLESFDALAARVWARVDRGAPILEQVKALTGVAIEDLGLHGAKDNYYDPRNSFVSKVLERKVGIPISLSVVFMSVGSRARIALGGTAVPMHFLVRVLGIKPARFVDCYNGGRILTEDQCRGAIERVGQGKIQIRDGMLDVISNMDVVSRLLANLKVIYLNSMRYTKVMPILDRLLLTNPTETSLLRERGLVHYRLGKSDLARRDFQDYLDSEDEPSDAGEIRRLLRRIS